MHAATIRGRLLFLSLSSRCGYYSRAATTQVAASIRINTELSIGNGHHCNLLEIGCVGPIEQVP